MTIQTLFNAWQATEIDPSVNPPATEAEIQAAEKKIGTMLPQPLREVYQLFNGGWTWELEFFPLEPTPKDYGLTRGNEQFIEYGWDIPKEVRLFALEGGSDFFGIWLPKTGKAIYNHPIIEVGTIFEEGCMGVAGTNLISFLWGWSAYYLMLQELDKSKEVAFLDRLQVPQSLRPEQFADSKEKFAQLRKWADPQLPDPSGNSYNQRYTITDLKRFFGET